MSALYRMPSLGSDMEAGTLIEWVKQPGERFAKGDVIAVVETQKGAIEVEVFQAGIMGRQLLEPGQTVPVGTPMAELEVEGATAPVGPAETEPVQPGESAVQPATGYQPMPPQPLPLIPAGCRNPVPSRANPQSARSRRHERDPQPPSHLSHSRPSRPLRPKPSTAAARPPQPADWPSGSA